MKAYLNTADAEYLRIINNILENGEWKNNRTGIRTKVIPFQHFQYDMNNGFPLLTTKKMGLKNIAAELEFFIKGLTSKKWLQDRKCNIWNEWANPQAVDKRMIEWQNAHAHEYTTFKECVEESAKLRLQFQKEEDDLGPVYGYQWRNFGGQYGTIKNKENKHCTGQYIWNPNGVNHGFDQLKSIVEKLKKNPDDRRMICSAWNPNQLDQMGLPACHYSFNLVHINGKLHLHVNIRSQDEFLGRPYNIASYALLLLLFCKESGFTPGILSILSADSHIYENHIEQMKEQLKREPYDPPNVEILNKPDGSFSIFDWNYDEFKLNNYQCHPAIKGEVAV